MTITAETILWAAGIVTALTVIYNAASKPVKAVMELKRSVDDVSSSVRELKETVDMQGDMVYQLLNHAATNNNTGGMQEALDKYNEWYRH